MQTNGPSWHNRVECAIILREPAGRNVTEISEPSGLWQVSVQHVRSPALRQFRRYCHEPVAHLRAAVYLPIREAVQVEELLPGAFLQTDERSLFEMPDKRNTR